MSVIYYLIMVPSLLLLSNARHRFVKSFCCLFELCSLTYPFYPPGRSLRSYACRWPLLRFRCPSLWRTSCHFQTGFWILCRFGLPFSPRPRIAQWTIQVLASCLDRGLRTQNRPRILYQLVLKILGWIDVSCMVHQAESLFSCC